MAEEVKSGNQKWAFPLLEPSDDFNIWRARLASFLSLSGCGRFSAERTPPPENEQEQLLANKAADLLLQTLGEVTTRVVLRHYPNPMEMIRALSEDLASKRTRPTVNRLKASS